MELIIAQSQHFLAVGGNGRTLFKYCLIDLVICFFQLVVHFYGAEIQSFKVYGFGVNALIFYKAVKPLDFFIGAVGADKIIQSTLPLPSAALSFK